MKKEFYLVILALAYLSIGLVNSCKKNSSDIPSTNNGSTGIATSFTEEFDSVYKLETKGWVILDNSDANNTSTFAAWGQGRREYDKYSVWYGFTAYSYTKAPDEFAYSGVSSSSSPYPISSWLITPVLSVKNGDKISFYTRGDTVAAFNDRMQVLINKSVSPDVGNKVNSVGGFSTVLFDINATQTQGGYPTTWTKYEYTFSGILGKIDTRIAFRHYAVSTANARGIGIDLFRFIVN